MDFFDSAYKGTPPWDIGRPQKEFVGLVRRGEITGSVLDIGCGTGEHALFFASEGFEVWGIDSAPLAIRKAQEKAAGRGLQVHFLVLDALDLARLNRKFDTVTDSGLFHTLSDEDRPVFVENLAAVLSPGGRYFMLCFSELEPGGYGPRRVTQEEIRESFRDGWTINYIRPSVFESRTRAEGPRAWLSSISKK
ncbi:MAG: class I SAM-dependent methyltransferase [Methanoregula sp.]|jgi:cyclopropane fatty-acyl-phospholipid synthase-like methyltransferase|uniref:class I SAM-dependent methyltransferase n=1 Tax=Methanoregula sp. TaxID=2052170 RepID=UPI003C286A5E